MILLFILGVYAGFYFIVKKYLVNIFRTYELKIQGFLSEKKFTIMDYNFNLSQVFILIKFLFFILAIQFFFSVSHMFYTDLCKLTGWKFFYGLPFFVLPYFIFVYLIYKILHNIFKRKFCFFDEIIDIIVFSFAIGVLSLIAEECAFYPGHPVSKKVYDIANDMETVEVTIEPESKTKNSNFKASTPDEQKQNPTVFSELRKLGSNIVATCKDRVEIAGEPDSEKNMKDVLYQPFPSSTETPLQKELDGEEQTKNKICGMLAGPIKAAAEMAGYPGFEVARENYSTEPFTVEDLSAPTTPAGTRKR